MKSPVKSEYTRMNTGVWGKILPSELEPFPHSVNFKLNARKSRKKILLTEERS